MDDKNENYTIEKLNQLLDEKNNEIKILNQELSNEKQINNKTKEYLFILESKIVEFDKQKEIINSLNSDIGQLKKEISVKNNEINSLKQELKTSRLTEEYIIKMLDLRRDLDKI